MCVSSREARRGGICFVFFKYYWSAISKFRYILFSKSTLKAPIFFVERTLNQHSPSTFWMSRTFLRLLFPFLGRIPIFFERCCANLCCMSMVTRPFTTAQLCILYFHVFQSPARATELSSTAIYSKRVSLVPHQAQPMLLKSLEHSSDLKVKHVVRKTNGFQRVEVTQLQLLCLNVATPNSTLYLDAI